MRYRLVMAHAVVQGLGIVLMVTGALVWAVFLIWLGLAIFASTPLGRRALSEPWRNQK